MLPYGLFDLSYAGAIKHVCKDYADREGIDVSRIQFLDWSANGDTAVATLNVFEDDFPTPHKHRYRRMHTDKLFEKLPSAEVSTEDLVGNLVKYFRDLAVSVEGSELTYSLFDNKVIVQFDNPILFGNYILPIENLAPRLVFSGTQLQ